MNGIQIFFLVTAIALVVAILTALIGGYLILWYFQQRDAHISNLARALGSTFQEMKKKHDEHEQH